MSVSNRLYRILKSVALDKAELFEEFIEQGESLFEEKLKNWEKKHGFDSRDDQGKSTYDSWQQENDREESQKKRETAEPKDALSDDLGLFDLKPPVTLEQVKKARNREMKKFHPDKFQQDPEKQETAKKIIQIYNAAYERIREELEKQKKSGT